MIPSSGRILAAVKLNEAQLDYYPVTDISVVAYSGIEEEKR